MANYEMVLVVDPRLTDEEVESLREEFRALLEPLAAEVVREESWGKRRLAYPIAKNTEGRYLIYTVETPEATSFAEVEKRLDQNESVLRYLTVRTDDGRLRRRSQPEPAAEPAEASA
ncbi:MAG: 30S ribosomal protein S6 [Thermoanaerobaculia bacterium]|nr:30S ribosomal protein S6 [Thermoanaerobaculia bacterium]